MVTRVSTATVADVAEVTAPIRFWDRPRRLGAALIILGAIAAADSRSAPTPVVPPSRSTASSARSSSGCSY